jgi:hypothetical protein
MFENQATLSAVLATVLRATADARTPVVLRARGSSPRAHAQAAALADWLSRAHGSRREVRIGSRSDGLIQVRLPPRVDWPDPTALRSGLGSALASPAARGQFTGMVTLPQHIGR